MIIERLILVAMWAFGIISFILFITRKKLREGTLAILLFQAFIWLYDEDRGLLMKFQRYSFFS
ncbi:hypothetical protein [Bacillus sp. MRMR6]|uniref:hypothetical protein n=1 Tax=Bacillus sp. MRMR6 TaxID=1928617 RepID=UPI00095233B8|nr:hypothetical protein [Bacillus sp. MRMR6]OLS40077.1 hypothetical protein BTR25_11440 [Bacillus sp. MRMR6]